MPRLLVIADDLSGATDVGVQFAKRGIRAFVTIQSTTAPSNLVGHFASHEVVLIDIESRHVSPGEAARRVTRIVETARPVGVDFFYKKTDSTLRGNVGAELEALLNASGGRTLCFVPAHPALGRTTRDGVQFVHDKPLHESAFAVDPRSPVGESGVAAILARQANAPITTIRQNELSAFVRNPPAGLVVFDAETEADVRRAAEAIEEAECLTVLAGPAAFASCLPDLIPFTRGTATRPCIPPRLLVVNGSLNEVTLRQCATAREHGFASVSLTPLALLAEDASGENARTTIIQETVSLLAGGRDVVLQSVRHRDECARFNRAAECVSPDTKDWPERIALNTGRMVAEVLSLRRAANELSRQGLTLVVFGGDTLVGIARANGWESFEPRDELLRGVALCEIPVTDLALVSKPGGFGDDDVLLKLRDAIGQ